MSANHQTTTEVFTACLKLSVATVLVALLFGSEMGPEATRNFINVSSNLDAAVLAVVIFRQRQS